MTLPKLTITQVDNALGATAPTTRNLAILACAEKGTVATPVAYTRSSSVVTDFGVGPLAELASVAINQHGLTVVCVRVASATDGSYGAVDETDVTGTSSPTAGTTDPLDAYEVVITVVTGGTIGVAGITWTYSLDGGRTTSPVQTQGTANTLTVPNSGVSFALSAGTLVAGDVWTCTTVAPVFDATTLATALTALAATTTPWDGVLIGGDMVSLTFDATETAFGTMFAAGKYHWWAGMFRVPNAGESDATYQTAFDTVFSGKGTIYGGVSCGSHLFTSRVTGRQYVRPAMYSLIGEAQSLSEEIDPAEIDNGPINGAEIRDSNGNLAHHDEREQPGLDDKRACTLRTWEGYSGVYCGNFRILSTAGSDFQFLQHRRVMNIALTQTNLYLTRRLSKSTRVNKTTGRILESERLRIQDGLTAKLRSRLTAKNKASDAYCVVAGDDDLLGGDPLTVSVYVVPNAYPKQIATSVGFINPALQAV